MPEIRTVSRAEGRQAAGAHAFDAFHERRNSGLDLGARRARIDAQVRPVAGAEVDDPDNWRAPTAAELSDIRERHRATSGNTGESLFARWRSGLSGAIGGLRDRLRDRGRNSPTPADAGGGNRPPAEPPEAPATAPPEEPDDQSVATDSSQPANIGPRLQAIIDPDRTGRHQEPSHTNQDQGWAIDNDSTTNHARPVGARPVNDGDNWRVPDQATFDAMRDRRAGASGNNTPGTTPSGRPIPLPPIPEGVAVPETGSWRGRLWERVRSARESVWDRMTGAVMGAGEKVVGMMEEAKDRIEGARDWAEEKWNSPLGRVVRKLMEDVAKDIEKGKRKGRVGWGVEIGKLIGLYGLYKGQELAAKLYEKKWDIATGVAAGAALRTIFITVGWQAYLAKAAAAGLIAGARKGLVELETYDKPESMKARLKIISRIRALDHDQKVDLRNKVLIASGLGFAGSFLGMEFMERTGLGDTLHNALGLNKLAGAVSGLGEGLPKGTGGIPNLAEANEPPPTPPPGSKLPNEIFGSKIPETDSSVGTKAVPGMEDAGPGSKVGVPPAGPDGTEGTIPGKSGPGISDQGKPGDIGKPEGGSPDPTAATPEPRLGGEGLPEPGQGAGTYPAPEAPVVNPIDQAIENLPAQMTLPQGSTPWALAEQLLKEANPNGNYTPADIMAVDKVLCQVNGVAVPEWGIEGKVLATRLPIGMNFEINDDVKNMVKQVALK